MEQKGFFISLEGVEGTGKSTHSLMLSETLESEGHEVVRTAEPGGTTIGQNIRKILLDPSNSAMEPVTELLLYAAARRQHIQELILPALDAGKTVITDRFADSTIAYQGTGRGLDMALISELDFIVTNGLKPDLTLLLDLDVKEGLSRNRSAGKRDRLELEDIAFHKRVREGFFLIAENEPSRVKVISASGNKDEVHERIRKVIAEALPA